ncbi:hypothetical protein ACFCYN_19595 [Gottfriedia sp. NPDC056225]|uniref:hypothetical protein n=1 Tax=Bacillaceae TaxID=186817 RepID=UPI000BF14679|nr:hypothetical protein [Bacillus sp. AFS002410]PEJ56878.1 hypothetical protein CN692_14910 [Bacillus sp. AFS002410]QKE71448.1 hypothetical protein HPK19_00920 [Arthrobacter citreus]
MLLAIFNELQEKEPDFDKGLHNDVGVPIDDVESALIELEMNGFISGLIWIKSDIDQKEIASLYKVSITPTGLARVIDLLR